MRKTAPLFFCLLFFIASVIAGDFRTASMGQVDLLLNHRENSLNLYRATGNSAYMIQAETDSWLKLHGMREDGTGDLKRFYEPSKVKTTLFHAEGYKKLTANQAFWGQVDYQFMHMGNTPYALEPDPYRDDPMLIADTTTGNFNYDGPQVRVRYQYTPFRRFSAGGEIFYEISQGLKKKYTRARILRRDFSARLSTTYVLGRDFVLGSFLEHQNLQDEIELEKSQIDGQDPLVRRYRSENVFWYRIGSFDHYDTYYSYRANLALQKTSPGAKTAQLLQVNYENVRVEAFDKTSNKYPDSDWYGDIFSAQYEFRLLDPTRRFNCGTRLGLNYLTSFSQHPTLDILITEREVKSASLEAGILYRMKPALELALQGGWNRVNDIYDDYQSSIHRDVTNDLLSIKFGMDYKIDPIHHLLGGAIYGNSQLDEFSPRYLPDYTQYQFSLGVTESRARNNFTVHFEYAVREARDLHRNYNTWRVVFHTQIFPGTAE